MQQICSYTVERHCCSKSSAEIDKGRTNPGIRVEGFIGKTHCVATTAGESFHQYMNRLQVTSFMHDYKLFLLRIVSGQFATAYGTGITFVKNYAVACQKTALDDIDKKRGNG